MRFLCTLCLMGTLGCSGESDVDSRTNPETFCDPGVGDPFAPPGPASAMPSSETPVASSSCGAVERSYPIEPSPHVFDCDPVSYGSNPPSSGNHYEHWAAFRVYDQALPRGFWVHSMEHGAVVIAYSCTDCAGEVESARAMIDTLPVDPACTGTSTLRRVILTPDPLLETRWAAAAWGFTLNADCFESEVFRTFAETHYAGGPEDFCASGLFSSP